MTSLVTARGVSKRYGKVCAVDNVSFDIEKGRIMGLIGPNGAGKTTLLKALLGLTDCEGDLSVLGLDPFRQRKELMQNICFIADVAVLPRWIRVSQLLDFVESTHPNFSREKAEALLGDTKVNNRRDSRVRELSKGMVTQLHLAIIAAIDARLLVLDEPTLGLGRIELLVDPVLAHRLVVLALDRSDDAFLGEPCCLQRGGEVHELRSGRCEGHDVLQQTGECRRANAPANDCRWERAFLANATNRMWARRGQRL